MSNKDIHKGLHPDIRQEYKARFLLTQLIMKNPHFKKEQMILNRDTPKFLKNH